MSRAGKSPSRRWGWWLGFPLALLLLLGICYYGYSLIHFGQQIQKKNEQLGGVDQQQPETYTLPEWEGKERLNILLLGGDGRLDEDPGRSDTIMVASIDPALKTVHLFSILRDTYTEIPGHGNNRINTALAFGGKEGPELASQAVGNLLGIPIHYYVFVEFESFIQLIDAIGGVDFYVEKDMKYTDTADIALPDRFEGRDAASRRKQGAAICPISQRCPFGLCKDGASARVLEGRS